MALRFLTAGESHGKALTGILEGIPSGLEVTAVEIHRQLVRRKLGYGRGARQKIETDEVEILSGIRFGKTLGSPITLLIRNRDWSAWQEIMQVEPSEHSESLTRPRRQVEVPRPGHADLVGGIKYQHQDMRNVLERSSARETTMRVALGAVARQFLQELGIEIASRVIRIGSVEEESPSFLDEVSLSVWNEKADSSPVRCLDPQVTERMIQEIESTKKQGDTLGGVFEVQASGVPVGLGSYVQWDRRLEGEIAQAFMSLNAIKGVEVGLGFEAGAKKGSEVHDEIVLKEDLLNQPKTVRIATNRSGGIDGGMSNGRNIQIRAVMKPLSTLMKPLASVNLTTGEAEQAHIERSDVCAVPSAAVIGESLLALVLAKTVLDKFGGDSMNEVKKRVQAWNEECFLG